MHNKPWITELVIVFLIMITARQIGYAEGEQSSPFGLSGHKPLSFVAISLEDGGEVQNATNIPTQPKFKIVFDKNVVASSVWANNQQCISLICADNQSIPIIVSKIDDTVDFSQKTNIFVQPVNPLTPETSYKLYISPDLKAKNGSLGQGITILFTTAGEAPVQAAQESNQLPQDGSPKTPAGFHHWQALLVAALIAGWILIEYLLKKRKANH